MKTKFLVSQLLLSSAVLGEDSSSFSNIKMIETPKFSIEAQNNQTIKLDIKKSIENEEYFSKLLSKKLLKENTKLKN